MLSVQGDRIMLTKGDSGSITVDITTSSGTAYTLQSGDRVILTVREYADDDATLILQKESTTSTITIAHADTAEVDVGQYSATIRVVTVDGQYFTLFPDYENEQKLRGVQNWQNFWVTPST